MKHNYTHPTRNVALHYAIGFCIRGLLLIVVIILIIFAGITILTFISNAITNLALSASNALSNQVNGILQTLNIKIGEIIESLDCFQHELKIVYFYPKAISCCYASNSGRKISDLD